MFIPNCNNPVCNNPIWIFDVQLVSIYQTSYCYADPVRLYCEATRHVKQYAVHRLVGVLINMFTIAWMSHFYILLYRNFPKLFDNNPSETKSEAKPEVEESPDKLQTPEEVPLVSSRENLAFEGDDKHLEPKDTSTDSTTSTMETTLESIDGEGGCDVKDVEKADDSGISVSHVNGSDVSPVEEGDEHSGPSMQPVLKSISAFAMQFTVVSPPEIKVDKPLTLSSVAKGESKDTPRTASPQSTRRHTEHNINKTLKKSSLLPEAALIKRRHSDFAVSAPRPVNEELAIADMKKRGSQETSK